MDNVNNFKCGLDFVLKWEGGYSNDPNDPGGETKWGISKRNHPTLDIKNLTPEQAYSIYRDEYWDAAGCDAVDFPYCVAVFDTAVNCGVKRAVNWLRDSEDVKEFIQRRLMHYANIVDKNPALRIYLKGWTNRVNDLKKYLDINVA